MALSENWSCSVRTCIIYLKTPIHYDLHSRVCNITNITLWTLSSFWQDSTSCMSYKLINLMALNYYTFSAALHSGEVHIKSCNYILWQNDHFYHYLHVQYMLSIVLLNWFVMGLIPPLFSCLSLSLVLSGLLKTVNISSKKKDTFNDFSCPYFVRSHDPS